MYERDTLFVETILAAKRAALMARKRKTPIDAIRALASMQRRPLPFLTTVTDERQVLLVGQIVYAPHDDDLTALYDPVGLALRYARAGVDAVTLFTDASIYESGLDDLALVARAVSIPVLTQDYILDDYHVVEARAAGASGLILDARTLDGAALRGLVSMTQRNRMSAIVLAGDGAAEVASFSPNAIALDGEPEDAAALRAQVPPGVRLLYAEPLSSRADAAAVAPLRPDAVLVTPALLDALADVRRLLSEA